MGKKYGKVVFLKEFHLKTTCFTKSPCPKFKTMRMQDDESREKKHPMKRSVMQRAKQSRGCPFASLTMCDHVVISGLRSGVKSLPQADARNSPVSGKIRSKMPMVLKHGKTKSNICKDKSIIGHTATRFSHAYKVQQRRNM